MPFYQLKKVRLGIPVIQVLAWLAFLLGGLNALSNPISSTDLSGTWAFTPLGGTATTIQVPGGGWYKQGFTTISEADYQRSITIPNSGQPQVTKIEFGAVCYETDLYINNVLVGTNVTSFTPSCFDISSFVTPGQSYTLRVHVKGKNAFISNGKSSVPNAAGWSSNTPQGIFRYAKLNVYPPTYISNVFVRPSVANSNLYYDVWVANTSSSAATMALGGNLTSWNGSDWTYPAIPTQTFSAPAGTTTKVTVGPIAWSLGSGSYWWPNVPYQPGYTAQLHNLNITLSAGSQVVDSTTARFGFRDVVQESDGTNTCYFLNGIRVNFRGDSLQGADFDSINYGGGYGDAYDTLPGFLPGTNGWPQAVDSYEHLNYNFVRLHQEPVTPYMLDVCDQMGLMVMEETVIRGSNNDQDFVAGQTNMINHLEALYTRDRNHPCIVRQSLSNEPGLSSTDSTQFEINLYNAAMSVDGTRPLSIDQYGGNTYESMNYSNFTVIQHYGNGIGQYTEDVWARPDRPFGQGEFVWNVDNTAQGFAWFATGTQAMRAQGASDIRPYTLLSAWVGFVPGVKTTDMTLEQGGNPLYGVNNFASPWTNSQIERVQAGFNPVLVADSDYWASSKLSDSSGDWPVGTQTLVPNQTVTRNLTVYNDTFSGTAVDVFWELREGSAAGSLVTSGEANPTIPLGYVATVPITFTVPSAPDGTVYYLVLYSQKSGTEMFRETSEQFTIKDIVKVNGTPFGASPPYAVGSEFDKADDGNLSTFYDYSQASGGYTGIDLGPDNEQIINRITFSPRTGYESRMVGGVFQGSNDGVNYTVLYTVTSVPSPNTQVSINNSMAYRYLEYVGPAGSYCNIAEMEFDTLAPNLQNVASVQLHGATPYSIPLSLTGGQRVECRRINGSLQLVFTFNQPVTSATADVTDGTGSVNGTPSFSGNTMIVNLRGVTDAQNLTVTLSEINDTDTAASVSFGVLQGDVNGDGGVNSQDVLQARNMVGVLAGQAGFNPRMDINEDGGVNSPDVLLVRNAVGHVLPSP